MKSLIINKIKNLKFSNVVVLFSFLYLTIFTYVCIYVNLKGGLISDELIRWNFLFFGIEVLTIGGIKIAKILGERVWVNLLP